MRLRILTVPILAAALGLSACTTSAAETAAPARVDSVRADLDAIVGSGAVGAVATLTERGAGTVVASGLADAAAATPIGTDVAHHIRVGSVTKSFTAAIVLQLVAEHRVDLDRSIDTYLPGLLTGVGVDGSAITVRQVLGHRSGLPEPARSPELDEHQAAKNGRTFTPAQEIALALEHPAKFAPGSRFEYTNINYIVAGMLIEAVTGHRYTDELRDRILTPLGLSNTYLPATGETGLRQPHPTAYTTVDGTLTDTTLMEPSVPWASGALVSTGADVNRFFLALLAGQVVPQPQLAQMLDGVDMGNGDGMSYGLGLGYTQLPCGAQYVGHIGGVAGFSTVAGATRSGLAVTIAYTGESSSVDLGGMLTHALCD
ncbi:serine hydrolase domain-containing protein [Nocardia sp. NPDC060249]|uniref:serine hydrolase domain-containing protein n=1 Tax=Nocardia sp. NPDC060249 TaxID=3347082 RepID=UPI003651A128